MMKPLVLVLLLIPSFSFAKNCISKERAVLHGATAFLEDYYNANPFSAYTFPLEMIEYFYYDAVGPENYEGVVQTFFSGDYSFKPETEGHIFSTTKNYSIWTETYVVKVSCRAKISADFLKSKNLSKRNVDSRF